MYLGKVGQLNKEINICVNLIIERSDSPKRLEGGGGGCEDLISSPI